MSDISQIKTPDNNIHNIKALSLVKSIKTTDETPYQLRQAPYQLRQAPSSIGNNALEKVVGLTVCFNQLVKYPDLSSGFSVVRGSYSISNNIATIEANGDGNTYAQCLIDNTLVNHVLLLLADIKLASTNANDYANSFLHVSWNSGYKEIANATKGTWGKLGAIVRPTASGTYFNIYPFDTSITANGEKAEITNPQVFDLTAMFGSTVADYLYNLENG